MPTRANKKIGQIFEQTNFIYSRVGESSWNREIASVKA